jgi:hypothetical protein
MGLGRAKPPPKGEYDEGGLRAANGVVGAEGSRDVLLRCDIGLGIPEGIILLAWTVLSSGSSLPESDESDEDLTRSEWRRLCFLGIGGVD